MPRRRRRARMILAELGLRYPDRAAPRESGLNRTGRRRLRHRTAYARGIEPTTPSTFTPPYSPLSVPAFSVTTVTPFQFCPQNSISGFPGHVNLTPKRTVGVTSKGRSRPPIPALPVPGRTLGLPEIRVAPPSQLPEPTVVGNPPTAVGPRETLCICNS